MKNKTVISLIMVMIIAPLAGCGTSKLNESDTQATQSHPVSEPPAPESSPVTETPVESDPNASAPVTSFEPEQTQKVGEYMKISAAEAQKMMSGDVIILDVRTQEEYDSGHIKDAILLPYDEISIKAESVIPDKNAVILVYCRSGGRSRVAANELIDIGYTEVYDFGGVMSWPGELVK